jgi:hypothetical protein
VFEREQEEDLREGEVEREGATEKGRERESGTQLSPFHSNRTFRFF